jgi:transcriptional regulator with XRE-family HTH domain
MEVSFMASHHYWIHSVTPQDKSFYKALGQRIAEARKAQGLTQVELANRLGISQQTLAHYEGGVLRIAIATLVTVAKTLNTPIEVLIGEEDKAAKKKRGPASRLQQQMEEIGAMPRSKQKFVMEMLDTVIQQSAS